LRIVLQQDASLALQICLDVGQHTVVGFDLHDDGASFVAVLAGGEVSDFLAQVAQAAGFVDDIG